MYALLDHTAQVFLNTLTFVNDNDAIRWFASQVNSDDDKSLLSKYPNQFTLYRLMDYDDKTGTFHPRDKKYLFTNKHGDPVYTSDFISDCWKDRGEKTPKGHITVASLTYRTVAYTARYTVKKIVPREKRRQEEYWIDTETGETNYDPEAYRYGLLMTGKIEEFITMSNGIGGDWYKKYNIPLACVFLLVLFF